jgi:hypothetical protein
MSQTVEKKQTKCGAAMKYPTKGQAYSACKDKFDVYLYQEITNGAIKQTPYGRCSNSTQDSVLCHIHEAQKNRAKSKLLLFEKDIKNKCDDKTIKKITLDSSFFKSMGDRGRNKKQTNDTSYDFKTTDDPILTILKTKNNPKLLVDLRLYAIEILKTQKIIIKDKTKEEPIKENISNNKELVNTINKLNKEHNIIINEDKNDISSEFSDALSDISDDDNKEKIIHSVINEEINEDINEEINEEINEDINKDIDYDIELNDESENDDDDSAVSCTEIYTRKGKLLYLEPESMSVIEPEGDSAGTSIGILYKIEKKYSTIIKDGEYYTVFSENKIEHNGEEYFRDILNNRFFNKDFEFTGRLTLKNNSEYKLNFD